VFTGVHYKNSRPIIIKRKTMLSKKEQIIKRAQDKAKELGHCLCNLKLECPCPVYKIKGICKCSECYIEKTDNENE